jgi:hypothetical protein
LAADGSGEKSGICVYLWVFFVLPVSTSDDPMCVSY